MSRAVDIIEEVPSVSYSQLVAQAGGRKRLRDSGQAQVLVQDGDEVRTVVVPLVEHKAWRGGSRTYLQCPNCARRVLRLHWNSAASELECRLCWGPTKLRYRCQEQRRLEVKEK